MTMQSKKEHARIMAQRQQVIDAHPEFAGLPHYMITRLVWNRISRKELLSFVDKYGLKIDQYLPDIGKVKARLICEWAAHSNKEQLMYQHRQLAFNIMIAIYDGTGDPPEVCSVREFIEANLDGFAELFYLLATRQESIDSIRTGGGAEQEFTLVLVP